MTEIPVCGLMLSGGGEVGCEQDQIRELIEWGYEDVKRFLEGCV